MARAHVDDYILVRRRAFVEPGEPTLYELTVLASAGMGTFDVVGVLSVAVQAATGGDFYLDEEGVLNGIQLQIEDEAEAEDD